MNRRREGERRREIAINRTRKREAKRTHIKRKSVSVCRGTREKGGFTADSKATFVRVEIK